MTRRADRRITLPALGVLTAAFCVAGTPAVTAQPAAARPASEAGDARLAPGPLSDRPLPETGAMLATEITRLLRVATATPIPTPRGLRAGVALAELAAEAEPDNPENWRLLLMTGRLAEDRAVIERALDELDRLVPQDDVVTLSRFERAIEDRGRTVEDRTRFLEFLVAAGREGRLTAPVASRIAYELALLRQRSDDLDGFAEALLTSLELDSSHVAAARTALDFFASNAVGAVDQAELFINLIVADPTDSVVIERLARLLLDEGAYDGAARMYAIAVDILTGGSAQRDDVAENLIADQALALWGAGDVDAAIRAIEDRERYKQDLLQVAIERRRRQEESDPGSTRGLEPLPDRLPLEVNLSGVRLAILDVEGLAVSMDRPAVRAAVRRMDLERRNAAAGAASGAGAGAGADPGDGVPAAGDPPMDQGPAEAYAALMADLRAELSALYSTFIESIDEQDGVGLLRAGLRLDHAWAAVSLLNDPAMARQRVAEAEEIAPLGLSDEAAARFEGWIQLLEGEPEAAIQTLLSASEVDPLARLGLARAYEATGESAKARVELRGVAVAARGTIAGVMAERQLRLAYGETMQPTADAARLEGLVSTVPAALDRLAWNQTGSLRLRAAFRDRLRGPFEPAIVDITLTNNGPVPLAISPRGPIVPTVLLVPEVVLAAQMQSPPIIVVDIQRRLRLAPREQVTVSVDLRRTRMGAMLLDITELGANLRVEAFINHDVEGRPGSSIPVFYPRAISADAQSGYLRIDGVPLETVLPDGSIRRSDTVDAMIRSVEGARGPGTVRLDTLGVINRFALLQTTEQSPPLLLALRRDAARAMVAAFPRLSPEEQAWIIAVSPTGVALPQYRSVVETSDDIRLRVMWLVNMVGQVDDPVLLHALASDDERLRRVGEAVDDRLRRVELGP